VALLERVGQTVGFSPSGRAIRVWIAGAPGGDVTTVVTGALTEVLPDGAAIVDLEEPATVADRELRRFRAVPDEHGWGLRALWFSFIAVNVYALDGDEPLARWFIRLNRR
jgi:multisubunit Na+/H+ antiporter MnhB subunit